MRALVLCATALQLACALALGKMGHSSDKQAARNFKNMTLITWTAAEAARAAALSSVQRLTSNVH